MYFFISVSALIGTKTGRVYIKEAPFNGASQTFGVKLPHSSPGPATVRNSQILRVTDVNTSQPGSDYSLLALSRSSTDCLCCSVRKDEVL